MPAPRRAPQGRGAATPGPAARLSPPCPVPGFASGEALLCPLPRCSAFLLSCLPTSAVLCSSNKVFTCFPLLLLFFKRVCCPAFFPHGFFGEVRTENNQDAFNYPFLTMTGIKELGTCNVSVDVALLGSAVSPDGYLLRVTTASVSPARGL